MTKRRPMRRNETMHQWAARQGLGYTGDVNPYDHGGYFYRVDDGFAEVSEVWPDCDDDSVTHVLPYVVGCDDASWEVATDRLRDRIAGILSCDPADVTPLYVIELAIAGESLDGVYKEPDGNGVAFKSTEEHKIRCRAAAQCGVI